MSSAIDVDVDGDSAVSFVAGCADAAVGECNGRAELRWLRLPSLEVVALSFSPTGDRLAATGLGLYLLQTPVETGEPAKLRQ